jgi:hypothetical protein
VFFWTWRTRSRPEGFSGLAAKSKPVFRQERKLAVGGSLHVNGGKNATFTEIFNTDNVNNN